MSDNPVIGENDIAIVGMAAHLPGAASIEAYWENLRDGVESIRQLSEEELLAAGESPARMRAPNYVPAAATLEGFERFDAEFFGLSPKEAAIMDPQHRQFLETAWEAMENAGHTPDGFEGPIGVYAGCGMGSYFYFNICSNPDLVKSTGMFLLRHTGNDKDFLSTRVSHIFDLKGPSLSVQTACSTSLVAVHLASQALLNGECDMALAGGVTIEIPQARGYLYAEGEVLSPDGHCHAFDHRAQGTVFGSGAGCVVLRRLRDAIADGDHIWAVIKGSAVNNDGSDKAGYLAPSVDGQARAMAEAHAVAGVDAGTIGYVECHGTGTYLGDPIEVAALTQAFRQTTDNRGYCRIGSVKTNIGHLDTAAGVASLIKASLSLHHRQMPPSLGYEKPNPAIDFETSPFRVNDRLAAFPALGAPRRAAVNSLGVGGTNAHVVLEEAPVRAASEESDWPFQPLILSARSKSALEDASRNLAAHLRAHPEQPLADIAWTLKQGRRAFDRRRVVVAESHEEAASLLETADTRRVFTHTHLGDRPEVVFMFPGGGAQYAGMARDLYETEPVFREWMDRGLDHLQPSLDYDLRALWLPEAQAHAEAVERLKRPSVQLPLIMITEYALAQLWISWGVEPAVLVGHSMGENTAACLAGVISFEDCIGLVHLRGQLFDTIAPGGMLSVPMSESALAPLLGAELDMASVNAPDLCVVSGPQAALDALEATLRAREVEPQRIQIDIAAHSRMLEPILRRFGDYLRAIRLSPPRLPIISNRSGKTLRAAEATNPDYWVRHLRNTVLFADCATALTERSGRVYLEVGPGRALSSLIQANGVPANQVLSSLRHPDHEVADDIWFMTTLGRLWALGVPVDWAPIWGEARRNRVLLPTYPFQRQPYYIEPGRAEAAAEDSWAERIEDIAGWGWKPHWRPRAADCEVEAEQLQEAPRHDWLVFADETGLSDRIVARLRGAGHRAIEVREGFSFAKLGEDSYSISPERGRVDYDRLFQVLGAEGFKPDRVAHLWLVTEGETFRLGSSFFLRNQEQGFQSLLALAQAMAEAALPSPLHVTCVSTGTQQVRGERLANPEKATVFGPLRVIPREFPGVTCSALDVALSSAAGREAGMDRLADRVIEELLAEPANLTAALRDGKRYELTWRPVPLEPSETPVPQGAACLITGGFGGIGQTLAERLVAERGARVALLTRTALPPRESWDGYLRSVPPQDGAARRIRALRRLEALGATPLVVVGDVCNLEDMKAVRAEVERAFGKVDVLIHAAGVVDDAPILTKTPESTEDVLAPKVHGTRVLDKVFPDGSLGMMVVFASTSTVTAPPGQVDYVAANEFLNAYARSRAGGKTRVVAINWGIWSDVGMAAEALAGPVAAPVEPVDAPMLDTRSFDDAGNRIYSATWDVGRWYLDGHRTMSGQALLPGTGYLDLAAQALRAQGETGPFEIRDLYFLSPLTVEDNAPREVQVTLARDADGYAFAVRSDVEVEGRHGFRLNAEARLVPHNALPDPVDLPALLSRCVGGVETGQGLRSPQEEHLAFGPRWRVLNRRAYGTGEGVAELALPEAFRGDLARGHLIHPALMDLATGWAMGLIDGYRPTHLWVPMSYASVTVFRPLPDRIFSWVRNADENRADKPVARFDVSILDPDGIVCVEIKGFAIMKLDRGLDLSAPVNPRDVEFPEAEGAAAHPVSAAEERLRHNLSQGIPAESGAEAFGRALALGLPQVVVSSIDLPTLVAQADTVQATEGAGGQAFERPELDNAYVEPRNEIERTLVGFWQELLGVGQVGVEDSFFDLGGHSLIAVRLFAMIRKTFAVEFPISILFEAPTIAACAALIEARVGPRDAPDGATPAAVPLRRFTHLVPMNQHEGGTRPPFFVVAGMSGNILNLRSMAKMLGDKWKCYGLQGRGLYDEDAPHEDLVDAARDCVAEIRQVQPHGPYVLGGFSGGGLTAWEIACQLEAEGEEVALLVLLDTPLPVRPWPGIADRLKIKLNQFVSGGPTYLLEWFRDRRAWKVEERARAAAGPEAAREALLTNVEKAFLRAVGKLTLKPRSGRTVLLRPPIDKHWKVFGGRWVDRDRTYVYDDNDLGRFASDLSVIEVPGDHDTMVLEPNVRVLVHKLREVLDGAVPDERPFRAAAE
ncbi:type I polyketide synthase [Albidovulum sediminicola]|uniref:SDR family NAD(P)-dependent oxidoreductase n=1 Tax=Albidovulum sediminicola TaxID=2984331 RepID=A0ABT2YZ44_9RHOB|nr:type I polyketide synthase [Defluviimonas sp. WL0075]MCV2864055.1 SDR family NAD(P)-dependent oxidoreductase [Defluviimonas sp. WL0075]